MLQRHMKQQTHKSLRIMCMYVCMYVCMHVYIYTYPFIISRLQSVLHQALFQGLIYNVDQIYQNNITKMPQMQMHLLSCCFFCFFSLFPQIFSCLHQEFDDPHWQMVLDVFCHKFAQNAKNSLVIKEVLGHLHRCKLLRLHIIRIRSRLLVMFQSCQRFHHLFRKKVGKQMLSKQSLQICIP